MSGPLRVAGFGVAVVAVTALLAVMVAPHTAHAQQSATPVARVLSAQGTVEAQRADESQWTPVKLNDTYAAGDKIRVQSRSRAELALLNQSVLRINENTSITLQRPKGERTGVVDIIRGAVHFFSRGPQTLDVQTPFAVAGVRGTEFLVAVEPERTLLSVFEGTVLAENQSGTLTVRDGQSAMAEHGKAPVYRTVARPRDAVTWALYYPPVLDFRPDELPADVSDPRFFAYRAHLLLAVGRADEAAADIQRALERAPDDPSALALQTIVAVVQNDKEKASQAAEKAVQAAPGSATAHVALSYAQQARFDLEGARSSVERAVQLDPKNALAWARLAELRASFGDLDDSLDAARKAVALQPNLSRTQSVLGYAYLTKVDVAAAREAFERAIALDSADPLPRLGLGLATIRAGSLDAGGRDIEGAAGLDASNALVRSYLGKTYYEEKRTGLDEREYSMAKQLDPMDPTPWFYDAIAKQTTNRPVEALDDLERAIELNGNRAVYRSKLLLDSDEAARSASLARIYTDLGFQQLALVEGWKSVNADPTSYSSHRFLADSYSVLPRHEIARVSELLQSQLLQPLNMTPIQPRLGESNLFLISAGGPGSLSFNEFNPLFNRDGVTAQLSGFGGEHSTLGGEGVVAGIYRKASFSAGYTHFETNGFRRNGDQKDDIANAFVQLEITQDTAIQAEYRYRHSQQGDLRELFYPESFYPTLRSDTPSHTVRVGGRHAFSPESMVLVSLSYQDAVSHVKTDDFPAPGISFDARMPQRAAGGEVQHLSRSRYLNLRSGAGYFHIDAQDRFTFVAQPPAGAGPEPVVTTSVSPADARHLNFYSYADVHLPLHVTITAGASFDHVSRNQDKDQLNPKLGVTWDPLPGTTVRAALFRVLKRTLITNQTLEPTQVAGFNQFFDDVDLAESWRYGAAVDQKLTRTLFGGVELSKRDLSVPAINVANPANPVAVDVDWKEYLGRTYLFWTPHPWFGLTAEYGYERFERGDVFGAGIRELETHRVPLGIRFFHPSGFSASVSGTFWNQHGRFEHLFDPSVTPDRDHFWTVDATVSWRLPKRYGFITAGATNVFDEHFRYFEVDFNNARIQPARTAFARLTLALP